MKINLSQVIVMLAHTDYFKHSNKVIWSGNSSARFINNTTKYKNTYSCSFGLKCDRYEIMFNLKHLDTSYIIPEFVYRIYLVEGDNYNSRSAIFFKMMADEWDIIDDIGITNSYYTKVLEYLGGWKKYETFDGRYNLLKCCDHMKARKFLYGFYKQEKEATEH